MIYEFMTDDGEIVGASFSMHSAPKLGSVRTVTKPDGTRVRATRILSRPAVTAADRWKPYVSTRLPRNLNGVRCTPSGKPIIETRAQERDIMAKFGYERE